MDKKNKNPNVPNLRFDFQLPWKTYKVDNIIESCGGGTPSTKVISYWQGDIPWISSSDLFENNIRDINVSRYITKEAIKCSAAKLCPKKTICIVSRVGVGKVAVTTEFLCTSQDFMNITHFEGNKYFLAQLIQNKIKSSQLQGTSIKGITSKEIKDMRLFIPSRAEQDKIVKFLNIIDQRIETQIKIISDYNSLKSGVYNWMFKENNVTFKLKQLAHIVKGVQINNDQLLSNGAYYMMNGGTLPSGYLDSYNVSENTISISEGGNSCGYVQFNKERFWSGGHCYTIQNVNPLIVENKYLYHYLKHKEKEIMNLRIGTGLPNIQKKDLENFTIFVPNLLIQRKNLALFEMLDEKICILNEELERLEKQKKYLLRNLFI